MLTDDLLGKDSRGLGPLVAPLEVEAMRAGAGNLGPHDHPPYASFMGPFFSPRQQRAADAQAPRLGGNHQAADFRRCARLQVMADPHVNPPDHVCVLAGHKNRVARLRRLGLDSRRDFLGRCRIAQFSGQLRDGFRILDPDLSDKDFELARRFRTTPFRR